MKNNTKLTITTINKQIKGRRIICISTDTDYLNNKTPLKWRCLVCDYVFEYSKNFIDRSFTGCKKCRGINAIELAKMAAIQKGGKCLTTTYTGSHDKIVCECKNGHTFFIAYNNMVNLGYWCAACSDNKFVCERIVRIYFESLFGEKFPKVRPNWLRKDNGYALELDGYCESLSLAFEHNGEYHYVAGDWNKDLDLVQHNDAMKLQMCHLQKVKLIVIPSLFHRTPFGKLRELIAQECEEISVVIPFMDTIVDLSPVYRDLQND